ncbi:hypothetical protein DL769_010787 [Monosporascus sp. CRB-8-3]|nr:hypothetical protein DL769_010787 [Monosporascus sp. CRB-8-3]
MKIFLPVALLASQAVAQGGYCDATTTIQRNVAIGGQIYRYHISYPAINTGSGVSTNCIMNQGANGLGVLTLQAALNECYGHGLDRDGRYGPKTKAAVRNVQGRLGLSGGDVDGIWGPKTGGLMNFVAWSSRGRTCMRVGTST